MKLTNIFENYIRRAETPIMPVINPNKPIIAIERWIKIDEHLEKSYKFMKIISRNAFVMSLLEYEEEVGHHAEMAIDERNVHLKLITKNVEKTTELDVEYAKFADLSFRDIVSRFAIDGR